MDEPEFDEEGILSVLGGQPVFRRDALGPELDLAAAAQVCDAVRTSAHQLRETFSGAGEPVYWCRGYPTLQSELRETFRLADDRTLDEAAAECAERFPSSRDSTVAHIFMKDDQVPPEWRSLWKDDGGVWRCLNLNGRSREEAVRRLRDAFSATFSEALHAGQILGFVSRDGRYERVRPDEWEGTRLSTPGLRASERRVREKSFCFLFSRDLPPRLRGDDIGGPRSVEQIGLQKQAEQLLHDWVQIQATPLPVKGDVVCWLRKAIPGLTKNQAIRAWDNAASDAWRKRGRGRVALSEALPSGLAERFSN